MSALTDEELGWLRDHGYDAAAPSEVREWFRGHGWEVVIVERDRREEFQAEGHLYFPGYGHRFWIDLVRVGSPDHVVKSYSSGTNSVEALIRAKQ